MKITEANEILKAVIALKEKMVEAKDFPNAARMRDIEKEYLSKEV